MSFHSCLLPPRHAAQPWDTAFGFILFPVNHPASYQSGSADLEPNKEANMIRVCTCVSWFLLLRVLWPRFQSSEIPDVNTNYNFHFLAALKGAATCQYRSLRAHWLLCSALWEMSLQWQAPFVLPAAPHVIRKLQGQGKTVGRGLVGLVKSPFSVTRPTLRNKGTNEKGSLCI